MGSGNKMKKMGMELLLQAKERNMKEIGQMENLMDLESIIGLMEIDLKVNGKMI